jgi:aminopeptidase N
MTHELAHQWFGDKVTCKNWENIWLNEGFATYSEGLFIEVNSGKEAYDSFISLLMNNSKNARGSIYVRDITQVSEIFNGARSYSKGAVVLHMLRGIVGNSALTEILRNYLNDPELAYNSAVTEDFQEIVENVTGSDFDYFFSEWIYGENYPKYLVDWKFEIVTGSIYKVDFKIEQAVNTFPSFFTMPVQIKISTELMDTLVTVFNNRQVQDFSIYVTGEPINFTFDPENLILKDVLINDPLELLNTMRLDQNYPNPFNTSTKIRYRVRETSEVSLKIIDILGNEVAKLVDEEKSAGRYEIQLDDALANRLSSGIYFYKIIAESKSGIFSDTKKMILIK